MTPAGVGGVNRRLLLFALILAVLSAILVYTATSRSGEGGGAALDGLPVVVAKLPIDAGTRITADMVEVRHVSAAALGSQPLSSIEAAVGNVARYPLATNEQLLFSKIVGTSSVFSNGVLANILDEGTRALAIHTSLVVGAGGLVLPGDHVDLLWIPDEIEEESQGARLLAENIEVLAVQQTLVDIAPTAPGIAEGDETVTTNAAGDRVRGSDAEALPEASTVTLMVTIRQATYIFCAEQSGSLRLAVRAFGDSTPAGLPPAVCVLQPDE
jgi:pilus assembly protein CpaB